MKKTALIAIILLLSLALTACGTPEERYIDCFDIIEAYEETSYLRIEHYGHDSEDEYCSVKVSVTVNDREDYIIFNVYDTFEEADACAEERPYNIAVWVIAVMMGEGRWLETGSFGNIYYEYYNSDLYKPFNSLITGN